MPATSTYELSDLLKLTGQCLAFAARDDRQPSADDIVTLSDAILQGIVLARRLENELSAYRWNDMPDGRAADELAELLETINEPGSNVVLFPIVPRPIVDAADRLAALTAADDADRPTRGFCADLIITQMAALRGEVQETTHV